LHISMQSGSDAVLRRMRRRWGSQRFVDRCRMVREALDRPALTTDIIVGFPGETDEDFAATCRMSEEVGFSKIHVFPFSPRKTTAAATMPDQVAPAVKSERVRRLAALERQLQASYFASLRGRELDVLVEDGGGRPGHAMGTACRYATVQVPGGPELSGRFVRVIVGDVADGHLMGRFDRDR